jgi:DNA-binding MarR family transcriptional regulator
MNESADLLWNIVKTGQLIQDRLEASLESTGLSLAKLKALRYLIEADAPMALGQLAEKIACVKSNVTQLVDRLENEGLVKRIPDPTDRRSVLAAVTDSGRERYNAGSRALAAAEAELLEELPAESRAMLSSALASLTATPA